MNADLCRADAAIVKLTNPVLQQCDVAQALEVIPKAYGAQTGLLISALDNTRFVPV
ncbi:hypothetical protein MKK65_04735 [Methylobacterium sp. J-001]|uniref:hypothetical protein n=1 Tax=Methylobacterium sp. J-001 TaxID=2836609 RepID=UPI001FBBA237|nr:hypothetical protein [Methylobacterium sp. J-001]MCJ2115907.1 hypothetical protein [Methylobacterium sp. J-001]